MLPNWSELSTLASLLVARTRSAEGLRAYQERRLRELIRHAYRDVPFYRQRFDAAHLRPDDIRRTKDLAKIPPVTKEDFRRSDVRTLISRRSSPERLMRSKTTGSTGVPLEILKTPCENWLFHLLRLASMRQVGCHPRWRFLRIGLDRPRPLVWRMISKFGFFRQGVIPMTLAPAEIAERILVSRPDVVLGLPTILALVAGEIRRRERFIRFQFAISGGELLTAGLRRQIESVFGRVYDVYASIEAQHPIAVQCRHAPLMHVNDRGLILELLDDEDRPVDEGQRGQVVLTSLLSFAMPIIRYRMGDLAVAGPRDGCRCGYPGTVIRSLEGRRSDFFELPDGRSVLAIEAAHLIQELAGWILQYELVQETTDLIELSVVPLADPSKQEVEEVRAAVQKCFGGQVGVRVRLTPRIEAGPGGKFRVIRTRLGSPYDEARNQIPP